MRFVIQRVSSASVEIDGKIAGSIGKGYMVLIGVLETDSEKEADKMVRKMVHLRIFEDENGKTNLDLSAVGGSLLLVSQFTLCADCRKGNRPSFIRAGNPERAEALYEYIVSLCRKELSEIPGAEVATGQFGAEMKVSLVNDGPFPIVLDSEDLPG